MAKRISLRQFQQSLVERLTSARTGELPRALLGVQVGRELWLADLADAGEIVPLPSITPVPLAKPWLRGLANIRGTLFLVIDFASFLGGELTPVTADARLLLPNVRFGSNCGLLVNRGLGLRSQEGFDPSPVGGDRRPWVASELTDSHGATWKKLSFPELLGHPQFMDVGA